MSTHSRAVVSRRDSFTGTIACIRTRRQSHDATIAFARETYGRTSSLSGRDLSPGAAPPITGVVARGLALTDVDSVTGGGQKAAEWLQRFAAPGDAPATVARELLADVITGFTTAETPLRLAESAASLGLLRAQQGRIPSGLVADVLALRPAVWARVSASEDDAARLLVAAQRLSDLLDQVVLLAVDAYVQESQRVLAARAIRDPLTGLLNRAAFDDALERAVAEAARYGPPSLLLVDLDGFKDVNDTLGHLAGDDVLVHVAKLLTDSVRDGDVVARLGGDEFAVLLPRTAADTARRRGERLVAAAAAAPGLRPAGVAGPVGFSVGAGWLADPANGPDLFLVTDEAMYAAKRSGGGRVVVRADRGAK